MWLSSSIERQSYRRLDFQFLVSVNKSLFNLLYHMLDLLWCRYYIYQESSLDDRPLTLRLQHNYTWGVSEKDFADTIAPVQPANDRFVTKHLLNFAEDEWSVVGSAGRSQVISMPRTALPINLAPQVICSSRLNWGPKEYL